MAPGLSWFVNRAEMTPAASPLAPYEALIEVTEAMCGLASAGHFDELEPLQQRARDQWSRVPAVPPTAAEPLLRRLQRLTADFEQVLAGARRELGAELGAVDRSRVAGRAYAPGGSLRSSQVDTSA